MLCFFCGSRLEYLLLNVMSGLPCLQILTFVASVFVFTFQRLISGAHAKTLVAGSCESWGRWNLPLKINLDDLSCSESYWLFCQSYLFLTTCACFTKTQCTFWLHYRSQLRLQLHNIQVFHKHHCSENCSGDFANLRQYASWQDHEL